MQRGPVKVVVVGDPGCGKTSLITAATAENFQERCIPVLPVTKYPLGPEDVLIHDTSSKPQDAAVLDASISAAEVAILCFDATSRDGFSNLNQWMARLLDLKPDIIVILAVCKVDLQADHETDKIRQEITDFTTQFQQIEVCIKCSARTGSQALDVFHYALNSVLFPVAPLFDRNTTTVKPDCIKALLRVFMLCDADGDAQLNDVELNAFQNHCFGTPLSPDELASIKEVRAAGLVP